MTLFQTASSHISVLMRNLLLLYLFVAPLSGFSAGKTITNVDELISAVQAGSPGDTIVIGPGTYRLNAPLQPKSGMTIRGAGEKTTIITHTDAWKPSVKTLPDPEVRMKGLDSQAYLIRIEDKAKDVTISGLTLRGPQLHGGIFTFSGENLHFHHLRFENFLWSGLRTYAMKQSKIHDCEFIDAGGKWKRGGIPGTDGGISGGAIFTVWTSDCEFAHNRISRTDTERKNAHFGIKGRGGKNIHIHHNTIEVNFSIEFPFDGADNFNIEHNILNGVISIPKHAGGKVPESGRTFHIHHNYLTTSYAIEFVRNGVEIDHNLFDFDLEKDGGNLISGFGKAGAPGPALFHNNLVKNPGRGVIWINEPYNHLAIRNNHIIARTTATPRKEGLFGFNDKSDFSTIEISGNIIECIGQPRPLLRKDPAYAATIRNNQLTNVSDTDRYENPVTDGKPGPLQPLKFDCGVHGEMTVDGWNLSPTSPGTPTK